VVGERRGKKKKEEKKDGDEWTDKTPRTGQNQKRKNEKREAFVKNFQPWGKKR